MSRSAHFFLFISIFLFFISSLKAQNEPNDCVNFIQACGNQDINLNVSGAGIQEIIPASCGSSETNSLWLRITIKTSGTLGFVLKPNSPNINEDYDFWVFGPNASCDHLGTPIRCSTTNPAAAHQGNNYTGMNGVETDTSEGPGAEGNSFVQWLEVNAGESYFIVIDRPVGNSAFNLTWNGSATITNPFEDISFSDFDNINFCDSDNNGTETFDFSTFSASELGSTSGFSISYYDNEQDAVLGNNPITTPVEVVPQTYYARIEHINSKCFDIKPIDITFNEIVAAEKIINLCDDDNDGAVTVNLNSLQFEITPTAEYNYTFYSSYADALAQTNAFTNLIYTTNQSGTELYYTAKNALGCWGIGKLKINFKSSFSVNSYTQNLCNDGNINVNLNSYNSQIYTGTETLNFHFFKNLSEAQNGTSEIVNSQNYSLNVGDNNFYVKVDNGYCSAIAELKLHLFAPINLGENEEIKFCPEEGPILLNAPVGFNSYSWSHDPTITSNSVLVNEAGTYTVTVTDSFGCTAQKTFILSHYEIPQILSVNIDNNNITIVGQGEGSLEYSIDNGTTWQNVSDFQNLPVGVYYARIKLLSGCYSESFKFVILSFPNTITPNDDGKNDRWNISFLEDAKGAVISIFDRYGKQIYSGIVKDSFSWNGKYLGRPLPQTTYWYIVKLPDGREYKGWIFVKNYQ